MLSSCLFYCIELRGTETQNPDTLSVPGTYEVEFSEKLDVTK
jgi:hypothetical protein